jgi:uncharacterized protein YndB with AHSA1/START domain
MPEFSRSATIDAAPDELFEFLSRVENLPKYFSRLTEAHHTRGDEVHVTADAESYGGQGDIHGEVHAEAWFRIDAEHRALRWGSEGEHDYRGELLVRPDGGQSQVAVTLHTEHDDPETINEGIVETLENIERIVTSSPNLRS